MSANFFGNLSQGYFGFYFGPTAESDVSTVSESLTVSDSSSVLVSYLVARSESLTASDTTASTLAVSAAISESLTVAESTSGQTDFFAVLDESVSLSDSESSTLAAVAALAESLTAADSLDATVSGTAVIESITLQDTSDSVLTPNPTPPAPDNSATTMAPGGAITISKERRAEGRTHARPVRYNYDGTEIKIKLVPEVIPAAVRTARVKSVARATEKASGFQPIIVFVASVRSMGKTAKAARIKPIVSRQVSVSSRAKTRSTLGNCVVSKFAGVSLKSKGFGKASAFVTKTQRVYSFSKTNQSVAGITQAFSGVKKSKVRCHGMVSAKQVTEFSPEETEMILAMAEREFFR